MNIKTDSANKVEEATSKMGLMCKQWEHFAAINHLVDHIDELHDEMPHDSKWITHCALATLNPHDLPDSLIGKTLVTLDVTINVHKWWLAAHQHFGKIIVHPLNAVYLEGQAAHPLVMPQHE